MQPTLAMLKSDRQQWARVIFDLFHPRVEKAPEIATAAFTALEHWDSTVTDQADETMAGAILGAFTGIHPDVVANPESAFDTCRRVASYFQSTNINVAFSAIRLFVDRPFSRYVVLVHDLLIAIASSNALVKSPIEMSLRGIAFLALFQLDHQYKFWPQLQVARDECVHGLLTWGSGREDHLIIATQIKRYTYN